MWQNFTFDIWIIISIILMAKMYICIISLVAHRVLYDLFKNRLEMPKTN